MDRSYKADIPRFKDVLDQLRDEFGRVDTSTDWVRLRIEPLSEHVARLDRLLRSPKFARETARLRRGVSMFHADLVYLRTNIAGLKAILADEKRRASRRAQT